MVSAEGMRVELSNGKSSVSGRLVIVLFPRTAHAGHPGTGTRGTGMVLREGGSGRSVSSTRQEAAPLAWQIASQ